MGPGKVIEGEEQKQQKKIGEKKKKTGGREMEN